MSQLRQTLSQFWNKVYGFLFPIIEEEIGELTSRQRQLIGILEMIRIEDFVKTAAGAGRPPEDRKAIARAFVAKAVYNLDSTRQLIERLKVDSQLRRICGWINPGSVPEEWSFSRAFAEFSDSALGAKVHETLIKSKYDGQIAGHISRDSTEIEAREKPQKAEPQEAAPKQKFPVGRPRKEEQRPLPEPTRLECQGNMTLEEMEADLPRACNVGSKKNSKGFKETWNGYKLHLDAADGQIPISCILTSASLHDSQAAIPLAKKTSDRVVNLYDLMDSAYDAEAIKNCSRSLNHVPIIDSNPRRGEKIVTSQ